MPNTVFDQIHHWLTEKGVRFAVLQHEPVFTSEQAAQVRGSPLGSGAKALVVKAGDHFMMLVLPADRKLDSKLAQKSLQTKSLRFANRQELFEMTGLEPGSVPPFGSLFHLPTILDPALAEHAQINFNAGDHARSISLAYADYLNVEQPKLLPLTSTI